MDRRYREVIVETVGNDRSLGFCDRSEKARKAFHISVCAVIPIGHCSPHWNLRFRDRIHQSYVIHGKDLRVDGDLIYIPVYMTGLL